MPLVYAESSPAAAFDCVGAGSAWESWPRMNATSRSTVTKRASRAPMSALSHANSPLETGERQRGGDGRGFGIQLGHLLLPRIV